MLLSMWVQSLIFINIVYNPVLTADSTTKFVSVIARHAHRAADPFLELYKNDVYKNYNFEPPGFGHVSKSGELTAISLGKFLRTTYKDLLGPNYISESIEARSTDIDRTKESLNFILKGLYPEAVIPAKFEATAKDVLLYPQLCNAYLEDYVKAMKTTDKEYFKVKGFITKLRKWTGESITSFLSMYLLYTVLDIEKFMNLTLPEWTQNVYPDGDLLKGTLMEYDIMNYDVNLKRQNGGRLINKFIEDMKSVKSGMMDKNRKLTLNVAYDLNIVAVLKALGVYYPHVPQYSSAVFIELHLIKEVYYVQVNYYLGIPEKMNALTIPGCETLCPLEKFSTLMKNVIPSSLDLECDKVRSSGHFETPSSATSSAMIKFQQIFSG